MATYVGYKKKGFIGSLVSTFGVVLPSFVMILLIATFISNLSENPYIAGAMAGLRAAALGLVVVAVIQMGSVVFKGGWTIAAAALSFVLIAVLNINTAYVILLFIIIGVSTALIGERMKAGKTAADPDAADAGDDADGKGGDR
jgi:chromate transporter